MSDATAEYWIETLNLQEHPEGGSFGEVYRSEETIAGNALPRRYRGDRCVATSIYFLLKGGEVSRFHRLQSDETWHFYAGSSLTLHLLDPESGYHALHLGAEFEHGCRFQHTIPHGVWFGATVDATDSFTLVGCTVAPGFDFADFELATRDALLKTFADAHSVIERLT